MTYLVPNDTAKILKECKSLNDGNMYLEFNRLIGEWQGEYDEQNHFTNYKIKKKNEVFDRIKKYTHSSAGEALSSQLLRYKNMLEEFRKLGYGTESIDLYTDWRLAAGVGAGGPLETGMTLHHLYGYPYIPATSVKGIARAAAYLLDENISKLSMPVFNNYIEKIETREINIPEESSKLGSLKELLSYKDEDRRIHSPSEDELEIIKHHRDELEIIRSIFGSQNSVGIVTFLDGLPREFPKLDVDVLNPHFGEYYMGSKVPPNDSLTPKPSFFLTVAAKTPFTFNFILSNNLQRYTNIKGIKSQDGIALLVKRLLEEGLKQLGAGGKTNAGYGYFSESAVEEKVLPKVEKKDNALRQPGKGEAIAEIISIQGKQVKVKIEDMEVVCSGVNPAGLGLKVGSKIVVNPNIEARNKKIISCSYKRIP